MCTPGLSFPFHCWVTMAVLTVKPTGFQAPKFRESEGLVKGHTVLNERARAGTQTPKATGRGRARKGQLAIATPVPPPTLSGCPSERAPQGGCSSRGLDRIPWSLQASTSPLFRAWGCIPSEFRFMWMGGNQEKMGTSVVVGLPWLQWSQKYGV